MFSSWLDRTNEFFQRRHATFKLGNAIGLSRLLKI